MKAYPFIHKHPTSGQTSMAEGLDLRDYFAARAMQGYLASRGEGQEFDPSMGAYWAYKVADAMLKAREVKHEHP